MKSLCNKRELVLVPVLALALWGPAAQAGVSKAPVAATEMVEPEVDPERAAKDYELPTSVAASQRNKSESIIKCWQEGRLVLDERGWRMQGAGISGSELRSDSGRFAKLKLMQFGETFCTLKYDIRNADAPNYDVR